MILVYKTSNAAIDWLDTIPLWSLDMIVTDETDA